MVFIKNSPFNVFFLLSLAQSKQLSIMLIKYVHVLVRNRSMYMCMFFIGLDSLMLCKVVMYVSLAQKQNIFKNLTFHEFSGFSLVNSGVQYRYVPHCCRFS